jgi:hypothetical protein
MHAFYIMNACYAAVFMILLLIVCCLAADSRIQIRV